MKRPIFGTGYTLSAILLTMMAGMLPMFMLQGCEARSYKVFSKKYPVLFSCDCQIAPYNQLGTPGRFLSVSRTFEKLSVSDPDGHETVFELSYAQGSAYSLGLGGLLLGTPCFNNDSQEVWAYDMACPQCEKSDIRLKAGINGMATCPKCGNSWDLNNSGFPTDSDSRPLYRYPVSRSGTVLRISNM